MSLALPRVDLQDLNASLTEQRGVELGEPRGGEEHHDLVLARQALHLEIHHCPEQLAHPLHVGNGDALVDLVWSHLVVRLHGVQDAMVRTQGELGDLADGGRKRRREQGPLPLSRRRQGPQDLQDGVAEAHVEKLVRLVQHQELELLETLSEALCVVEMVLHSSWRCHQDVAGLLRKVSLVAPNVRTAIEAGYSQLLVIFQEDPPLLGDLRCQLPRRRQHERGGRAADAARVAVDPLDHGDQEGERLAGARLRPRNYVLAVQHGANGGCLHLCHKLVAKALCQRCLQLLGNLQRRELRRREVSGGNCTRAARPPSRL
mmetsp:Transcript_86027/g.256625  ORF Transcript_86027/g.256625 Transcript_86027/m.256625 type:complete len:317 (-) Transcript_86027:34-984(-)